MDDFKSPIVPHYTLTKDDLHKIIEEAATLGAKKALNDVGLHDEEAGDDVKELRGLLDSWRSAKATAWKAIVQAITIGFLGLLAGAVWFKSK